MGTAHSSCSDATDWELPLLVHKSANRSVGGTGGAPINRARHHQRVRQLDATELPADAGVAATRASSAATASAGGVAAWARSAAAPAQLQPPSPAAGTAAARDAQRNQHEQHAWHRLAAAFPSSVAVSLRSVQWRGTPSVVPVQSKIWEKR